MSTTLRFNDKYGVNRIIYQRHADFIDSSQSSLAKYLIPNDIEAHPSGKGENYFKNRQKRLDTENDVENCLNILYSDLTKKPFIANGLEDDRGQMILSDIDGAGNSAWNFTKTLFWNYLSYGFTATETEASKAVGDTMADANASGERSFSRTYDPRDVLNWEYFTEESDGPFRGQLKEVLFKNRLWFNPEDKKTYQLVKRLWLESPGANYKVQLYRSAQPIDAGIFLNQDKEGVFEPWQGELNGVLDRLPVVFVADPDEGPMNSRIRNGVINSSTVLNKQSAYDNAAYHQGFQRVFVSGLDSEEQFIYFSEHAVSGTTSPDASVQVIQPADPVALWRDIQRLRMNAKREMLLQHNQITSPESKEVSSFDSKRADAETRINYYNETTDIIRDAMVDVLGLHAEFEGLTPDDIALEFPRDFELKDTEHQIQMDQLLWERAALFGPAGKEIQRQLLLNELSTMPIIQIQDREEDEIRAELIEQLADQEISTTSAAPTAIRLADRRAERALNGAINAT